MRMGFRNGTQIDSERLKCAAERSGENRLRFAVWMGAARTSASDLRRERRLLPAERQAPSNEILIYDDFACSRWARGEPSAVAKSVKHFHAGTKRLWTTRKWMMNESDPAIYDTHNHTHAGVKCSSHVRICRAKIATRNRATAAPTMDKCRPLNA